LGGIKPDPNHPGFKNILLEPHFVKGLDHFEATHEGPYGTIVSSWKRSGTGIIYTVTVPPNSTASLRLAIDKDQKLYENGKLLNTGSAIFTKKIKAGTYSFELKQ
jgi:alpha-L-rhamnosidase